MARDQFDRLAERVRNWGRWGTDDHRGTLNLIGGEQIRDACREVTAGKSFNLGLNFDQRGPQLGTHRLNPRLYVTEMMTPLNPQHPSAAYTDDVVHLFPQCATQWDSLAHVHYDGRLYNGHAAGDTLTSHGAMHLGIEHLALSGIMSRGVLLDIARLKGVAVLPVDYAISPDDLDAACAAQGTHISRGDILIIRTGHMRRFLVDGDAVAYNGAQAGLSYSCAEWVFDKTVAAVAADNIAVEIMSEEMMTSDMPLPLHMLLLRDMGCPLGEMFNLEALAADCAADGRYSFLLSAPPLAITGAVGSPVNPMAVK